MTALVADLKANEQDHEFYPTTNEILRALTRDLGEEAMDDHGRTSRYGCRCEDMSSLLDIGAGNGKVLKFVGEKCGLTELHAIEKSPILCSQLDAHILIVGTEFHEQSLLSKAVDITFCNPPYSEFEDWADKIIRQSASKLLYLVIPQRWQNSNRIADALRFRKVLMPDAPEPEVEPELRRHVPKAARCHIVGAFDFEDAEDRTARAKVHLLRIEFAQGREEDSAFELFFKEQFAEMFAKFQEENVEKCPMCDSKRLQKDDETGKRSCLHCSWEQGKSASEYKSLVVGPNYPEAMVALYNKEMAHIHQNYKLVAQLDVALLKEFNISPDSVMAALKTRMKGLKNDYWNELFSHLHAITDRLTVGSRKSLLGTLQKHVEVDFTVSNILEVVLWVIKNANRYIDSQLIETYEHMVDKANVIMYKSNKKTWVDGHWRYNRDEKDPNSHYALDYRIVTHRLGGCRPRWSHSAPELTESGCDFIADLLTIARNLGFNCSTVDNRLSYRGKEHWKPGQTEEFYFTNKQDCMEELFDVRAFQNGNMHFRLNKNFILALNVEHGRLKGWLRSPAEAVEELDDPKAAQYFNTSLKLGAGNPVLLLT